MSMNRLNSKNYQRIRISQKAKTFTFTNDSTFKTKLECEATVKSNQYITVNQKTLQKMIAEGWTETPYINKGNVCKSTVEAETGEWMPKNLLGDKETEEAIARYYIAKKSKEEANKARIEAFLTPVPQPTPQQLKQPSLEVAIRKAYGKYYRFQEKRNIEAKQNQIDSYCQN